MSAKVVSIIFVLFLLFNSANVCAIQWPDHPTGKPVEIVYPRDLDSLGQVTLASGIDSTFLLGNVANPAARLWINRVPIAIDSGGGWLAWLKTPSRKKSFQWNLLCITGADTFRQSLPVVRPQSEIKKATRIKSVNFAVETTEGARIKDSPSGHNVLLPITGTRLLIRKLQAGSYGFQSPTGKWWWIDSSKTRRVKSTTVRANLTTVTVTYDSSKRESVISLLGVAPALFSMQYDTTTHSISWNWYSEAKEIPETQLDKRSIFRNISTSLLKNGVRFTLQLAPERRLSGYRWKVDENAVSLVWRELPERSRDTSRPLSGWKIVVDAGHGGTEFGAIGPTWLWEKTANLAVANRLVDALRTAGATVVATRTIDTLYPLNARITFAESQQPDLLVSVHQNALPDGENPWNNTGSATYYYHPTSLTLATSVQRHLIMRLALPDRGVYNGDFAICRSHTQLALLTESTFIIRPDQEQKLRTPAFIEQQALAIRDGIIEFALDRGTSSH